MGHQVKLVEGHKETGKKKDLKKQSLSKATKEAGKTQQEQGLKGIMEQAMPMLEVWLKDQMKRMGIKQPSGDKMGVALAPQSEKNRHLKRSVKESYDATRKAYREEEESRYRKVVASTRKESSQK